MSSSFDGFLPLFLREAARQPDRVFARFPSRTITFGDLDRMSSALCRLADSQKASRLAVTSL